MELAEGLGFGNGRPGFAFPLINRRPASSFPHIDEALGFRIPRCSRVPHTRRNSPLLLRKSPKSHPLMDRKEIKRCVVAFLPLPPEEEDGGDAGEEIPPMPCTAAHGNAAAESPLEQQQQQQQKCATGEAMAEDQAEEKRSSKRKARRASKPAETLVPADGEEMILVPRGKLALSKKLVEKILSLERMELPHVADILDDDNPNPSKAEKALRKCVIYLDRYNKKREDKFAECQDVIRRLRHSKGYAVVDNHLEFRVAVCKAGGVFLLPCHVADIIPEGFDLVSN
uniref:Uncharacterized protein n=1 Tax=Oryza punctata TaxID=4537 RepID=A0A0E0MH76_ORYPU